MEESLTHAAGYPERPNRKQINLALQGGGSHGAFAWGALDRILEDGRIGIEGIVGTSAGAMNAAVAAYGLTLGGNEGARRALRRFWEAVAETGVWS
ncbi:MAG TPA: patatin-like phospholipase family protein, partial [Methyloceanibacter sp.]